MHRSFALIGVAILSLILGAAGVAGIESVRDGSQKTSTTAPVIGADVPQGAISTSLTTSSPLVAAYDFAALYAAVRPSIVEIDTVGRGGRRFSQQTMGQGSGIVLDTQGHILTNYHVISGSQNVTVTFVDGSTASATVTGSDQSDDLAVIQTNADSRKLHPATLGDSSALKVGNAVAAVGNPFGLAGSLSTGVLSATDRTLFGGRGQADQSGLLQTDAAVNEGSSGGGLFNTAGELVGITSALENPDTSTFAGVGYAVPVNTAKSFLHQLLGG